MDAGCMDSYYSVESLLQSMCWRICRRFHHVDFDEAMSSANEAYMVAYNTYDPTKGASFPTWVYWQVRGGLQAFAEREKRYTIHEKTGLLFTDKSENEPELSKVLEPAQEEDVELGLSQEARQLLHLILETPEELARTLADMSEDGEELWNTLMEFPKDLATMLSGWDRSKLRRVLRRITTAWGWSLATTANHFQELEESVTG